ncbi:hypothetical protein MD484_g6586, partial [Candolleomyces efflorescens]
MTSASISFPNLEDILFRNVAPSDLEKASLQQLLTILTAQAEPTHRSLVQYLQLGALSSPIRRIPIELLREIFTLVFPSDCHLLGYKERVQLVNLQLVCRTWRDTARATGSLWSGVSVDETSRCYVRKMSFEKISNWLKRSGTATKSLAFVAYHCLEDESGPCPPDCKALGDSFSDFFADSELVLGHFQFSCDGPQCFRAVLDALKPEARQSWDAIRSISLDVLHNWEETGPQQSLFHQLPASATSFKLSLPHDLDDGIPEAAQLYLPHRVLERLTTLDIECSWCDPAVLPQLERGCINVEVLAIELSEEIVPDTVANAPAVFPQVRDLHLKNVASDSDSIMLEYIKAPKLVNLEVSYRDYDDYVKGDLARPLRTFLKRSACEKTLSSLCLRDVDARVKEIVKILVALPSLTSLKLEGISSTKDRADFLFEQLTTRDAKSTTQRSLPHLEDLQLLRFDEAGVPGLLKYLKSRRPYRLEGDRPVFDGPADTITTVVVVYSRRWNSTNVDFGSLEEVRALRWCGVKMDMCLQARPPSPEYL